MIKAFNILGPICALLFLFACAEKEITPEDQLRQYIESGKRAAENRSHSDLGELIANDYRDHKKMDKHQLVKLLRAYFFKHRNIYLFTKIKSIDLQKNNRAKVVLHVAMAGQVIANIDTLASLRAKVYRFELLLIKEDAWLLEQAIWERSSLKEMLKL